MSSDWNGFGGLDLTEVEADRGRASMLPGNYICAIIDAEVRDTKDNKGKTLFVSFKSEAGEGSTDTLINLKNSNAEAERIGRGTLKALLISANHPNPNKPSDVKTLKGLKVGIRIEQSENWTDINGNIRPGGGKVRRSGAFFDPTSNEVLGPSPLSRAAPSQSGPSGRHFNDDIPF